jgi:hypothetical protein
VTEEIPTAFNHFVLTRFNVRMEMYPHVASDAWLRDRLELFRRYCLPCIQQQTTKNFRWVLFFDAGSPNWFRETIAELESAQVVAIWVDGFFDADSVRAALRPLVSSSHVITTRLDNDDAVAFDFVERIQDEFREQSLEFVNLVDGTQFANHKVYLRPYTRNPFISLIEQVSEEPLKTVFVSRHFAVESVGHVHNVKTSHPMWLQVIHDDNTLNELVGLRARASRVTPYFACQLDVPVPERDYVADRVRGGSRILLRLVKKPARVADLVQTLIARQSGSSGSAVGHK